jgi:Rap guanine nucleotide exchange factor 1
LYYTQLFVLHRTYSFKKQERIIAFFSNFDEFLCEEAMWQISEAIKPRGGKK